MQEADRGKPCQAAASTARAESGKPPHATSRIVGLLGLSFNSPNRGVAALASGTINAVHHAMPDCRIFVLDYGRASATYAVHCEGGLAQVELVNLRYSWKLWLPNNIVRLLFTALILRSLPSKVLRSRLVTRHKYLGRIHAADWLGSIAGGDSFSDIYGLGRLLYVTLPQVLVLLLDKPLVLLPQTLGPFRRRVAKGLGRWIMRRARLVYGRDRQSVAEVRPMMPCPERVRFGYDMAFALEPCAPTEPRLRQIERLSATQSLVGINVSGLLYMGGYTQSNMFGLKSDYRRLVRAVVRYFLERDVPVLLVPHVFADEPGSEGDQQASQACYRELAGGSGGRLHLLPGEPNQHELKHLIGKCDFFIGSRMHACIAALSQAVPAVGLAYSRKFLGVFDSIEVGELAIDLREVGEEAVLKRLASIYEQRARIRKHLRARMNDVKASVLSAIAQLAEDRAAPL